MTLPVLLAAALAAAVVAVVAALLPDLLRTAGLVDTPTGRSSHTAPTPRGGGVAVVAGLVVGAVVLSVGGDAGSTWVWGMVAAVTVTAGLGLVEDARGLSPGVRLAGQLLVGAAVGVGVVTVDDSGWVWVPVAAVAFAAYVNATNFMDGVDTITAWHLVAAGATFAVGGAVSDGRAGDDTAWLVPAGVLLVGAGVGFLPVNGLVGGRARLFLGDVGSYAAGAAVVFCAGAGFLTGLPLEVAVAPLVVWLADTGHTLLRRMAAGEQLSVPHRLHAYQRLSDSGLSHRAVGLLAALFTGACGAVALAVVGQPLALRLLAAVVILVLAVLWLSLPAWRGHPYPRSRGRAGAPT